MTAHMWAVLLWAVALAALLRLVYALAWRIPRREAAVARHPAGRHRADRYPNTNAEIADGARP